jgi:hypothetical protein
MEPDRRQKFSPSIGIRENAVVHNNSADEISKLETVRVSSAMTASEVETHRLPLPAISTSSHAPTQARPRDTIALLQLAGIVVLVIVESGLLVLSLVPPTKSAELGWSATNGPFPSAAAPIITAIFYLAPFACGLLARRWEIALVGATFPAWFGIGIYTVAASTQNGIFALTSGPHPSYLVGTIELFAALGGFGWIARKVIFTASHKSEAGE